MTSRLSTVNLEQAPQQAKDLLARVKSKFGMVPNLLKIMAQAPAVLEGYLSFSGALAKGTLPAKTREQIALEVSQENGCEYCLSGHTATGKLAGLKPDEILAARKGTADDPKAQAVLTIAKAILERRGHVSDEQVAAAMTAGLTEGELVEIVGNISNTVLTNFLNELAHTDVDFPKVTVAI